MPKIEIINKEKLVIKGMCVFRITGLYANVKYAVLVTVDEETYKLPIDEIEKLHIIGINSEFEEMLKEDFPKQFQKCGMEIVEIDESSNTRILGKVV